MRKKQETQLTDSSQTKSLNAKPPPAAQNVVKLEIINDVATDQHGDDDSVPPSMLTWVKSHLRVDLVHCADHKAESRSCHPSYRYPTIHLDDDSRISERMYKQIFRRILT